MTQPIYSLFLGSALMLLPSLGYPLPRPSELLGLAHSPILVFQPLSLLWALKAINRGRSFPVREDSWWVTGPEFIVRA